VKHYVQGVQSQGVMATVKHWALNNQEYMRGSVSAKIDERTQFELYYPPFKAAIDAGVGAVMCSYNKINGTYACENDAALNRDLKQRLGFKGLVMSDWGATHSTEQSANGGLDLEMPDNHYFGDALKKAVDQGTVSKQRLDEMVERIYTAMFSIGIFDHKQTGNITADAQSKEHAALARKLSAESTVLLKNDNVLPLDSNRIKSIAIIGIDGHEKPIVAGGGSGSVVAPYIVTPLQGIKARVPSATVTYANGNDLVDAASKAKSAQVAIVFVSEFSSEGIDRTSLALNGTQDQLVKTVAMAQPNTIVVAHIPGTTLLPWHDVVKGILCAFMPGQEAGNAIADVLFGDVNPSAKLPLTFPISQDQLPINTKKQYPGIDGVAEYSEKLQVGYRWYDANNVAPLFAFGHGLSYTTFKYSNLTIGPGQNGAVVKFDLQNTGPTAGAEVPQLYVRFPDLAGEPPLQLRSFRKVFLKPGEKRNVAFDSLELADLSIWDVTIGGWKAVKGTFHVAVGSSSRDIRLTDTTNVL
jgi:beta-glucosidase